MNPTLGPPGRHILLTSPSGPLGWASPGCTFFRNSDSLPGPHNPSPPAPGRAQQTTAAGELVGPFLKRPYSELLLIQNKDEDNKPTQTESFGNENKAQMGAFQGTRGQHPGHVRERDGPALGVGPQVGRVPGRGGPRRRAPHGVQRPDGVGEEALRVARPGRRGAGGGSPRGREDDRARRSRGSRQGGTGPGGVVGRRASSRAEAPPGAERT